MGLYSLYCEILILVQSSKNFFSLIFYFILDAELPLFALFIIEEIFV